jgi:Rab3 GTPase-activating protein catalytic subunit
MDELEHDSVSVSEPNERKDGTPSVASTVIMNNATGQIDEPWSPKSGNESPTPIAVRDADNIHVNVPIVDTLPNKRSFGAIAESPEEEHHSQSRGSSIAQEFYDAEEGRSLVGSNADDGSVHVDRTTSVVAQRQGRRRGARCPVHGVSLVASGDQLYAPYLQRPPPATDDVIWTRRQMLSRHRSCDVVKIQDRLEIAHRLQRPKLLSDMRAFQAANPGSVFQDFINWYGNPDNPLEDPGEESETDSPPPNGSSKMSVKLDQASEAIQILTATRDFFSNTWDEATPCAAVDQEPLFDAFSTVEMVLDSFETMHPANLVNQIMAVNLSAAYFTLASSAGDALHVGMVTGALKELREKTEHALRLLARDATFGAFPDVDFRDKPDRLPRHASLEAIRACDAACNLLSTAEASVARATSILHKFPRQHDLAQNMLRRADGEPLALEHAQARSGILHVIHEQQAVADDALPVPSLREYILRNTDESSPCQLCVRFGDEGAFEGIGAEGGVMVALTKGYRD